MSLTKTNLRQELPQVEQLVRPFFKLAVALPTQRRLLVHAPRALAVVANLRRPSQAIIRIFLFLDFDLQKAAYRKKQKQELLMQ